MYKKGLFSYVLLCLVIMSVIFTGCSSQKDEPTTSAPTEKVELTISAAASLTDALKEIQTNYEGNHSNIKLSFNFGASGALQQQIEQGAPADLFFSASSKNMNTLIDKKLIDESQKKNILRNELVVVVPANDKANVHKIDDLSAENVKYVALGEPKTVPAGNYAKESLTYFKLWDSLQPKMVQGKDVRQVLTYVESGNAEAGFVYKTDALTSKAVTIAFNVDPQSYTPIQYPAGIVKATKHSKEISDFYTYLQGKEAQEVFVKYGFSIPE